MKEKWREKLVKKGIKEEKRPASVQTKTFSLHSNRSISNENSDFQERTPFESQLFLMAKKHVLKKRKELQENHQHMQMPYNNLKLQDTKQSKSSKKPKFKLDLTELLNHETLNSMNKIPNSMNTEIKKSKTLRFSYLFHEDELSFNKFNTTTRKGDQKKNSFENLKFEEPKKISQGIKIKFERALEKLRNKKENNITNKSVEEKENGMEKNKLQKFIQMMFQENKNSKKNSEDKKVKMNEKNNIKSILSKENCSQLYLYNNSFQDRVRAYEEKKFETDRESKCGNIHVEKMKKKLLLKNKSYIKALIYFKKSKKKDVSIPH